MERLTKLKKFTFQYGSINTGNAGMSVAMTGEFTFQYGSINTLTSTETTFQMAHLHSNMVLLIPVFHKSLSDKHYSSTFCRPCHFLFFRGP